MLNDILTGAGKKSVPIFGKDNSVNKSFGTKRVIENLDLSIPQGEVFGLDRKSVV